MNFAIVYVREYSVQNRKKGINYMKSTFLLASRYSVVDEDWADTLAA